MARLKAAQRAKLPSSDFGVPGKAPGSSSYPMPDRNHAIAAKRLAHNASPSERPKIIAKANRVLGKKKG